MKTTKKFLAIFLALTVLFTVCSLSVFATANNTWTTSDFEDSEIDYNDNDGITGEGKVEISANGRTIQYGVVSNYEPGDDYTGSDPICTLYAQCAVMYTDGLSEVFYIYQDFMLTSEHDEYYFDVKSTDSNKVVDEICFEFQIFNANGILWEGMLDISYANE